MASSTVVHETIEWGQATGVGFAAAICDEPKRPNQSPFRERDGAGCKSPHPHLSEGRGEVFFLDILFHRMSVMAMFHQPTIAAALQELTVRSQRCWIHEICRCTI